jgi:acyl-CoA synthetase (AMP-forming)/AMP-acid ligase II
LAERSGVLATAANLLELRDELPRNPLGKILKRELRDELRQ